MESVAEVRAFVLQRIGDIYERPLMYGDRPEGVDFILYYYHELIERIDGRDRCVLDDAHAVVGKSIDCPSAMCFGTFCRQHAKDKTEAALAQEIVALWKRVDLELGRYKNN